MRCVKAAILWAPESSPKYSNKEPGRNVEMAEIVGLACTECKRRNYSTTVNKKKQSKKLELNKFCKWCGKHTLHKEGK